MNNLATQRLPQSNERVTLLNEIIKRFTDSSQRLEARYQEIVTESNALREQLRQKDELMQRSFRLAALGEAAATIAHEIRNPLGAMTLMTSLLLDDSQLSDQQKKLLETVQKSICRMETFVADLLQFAKGGSCIASPLNIHTLLERIFKTNHLLHGTAVQVQLSCTGQPFVMGHEESLERVFINLLSNALRAIDGNGIISVTCRENAHDQLVIEIGDSGKGIPGQMLEKLFEPFVSASDGGTGLGLAIVKQLVLAHQGTISARNEVGARFTITLPINSTRGK